MTVDRVEAWAERCEVFRGQGVKFTNFEQTIQNMCCWFKVNERILKLQHILQNNENLRD